MFKRKSMFIKPTVLAVMAMGASVACQKHYEAGAQASSQVAPAEEKKTGAWFKVAPPEDQEVLQKVLQCTKKGDFDSAVTLALQGVNGKPPDDFLLQTIAYMYFQRAQEDPAKRMEWVSLAVQYSERALKANPGDVVNLFNLGESYQLAGMNAPVPSGCGCYRKSLEVFERLAADPILKNDWGVIEGERVRMEAYRQRLDDKVKEVRMAVSRCATSADKQGKAGEARPYVAKCYELSSGRWEKGDSQN